MHGADTSKTLIALIAQANDRTESEVLSLHSMVPFNYHTSTSLDQDTPLGWSDYIVQRHGLEHPSRRALLCEKCLESDLERGYSHWRRDHQLPGELTCRIHAQPLIRTGNIADFGLMPTEALDELRRVGGVRRLEPPRAAAWIDKYLEFASHFMHQRRPIHHALYVSVIGQRATELRYCREYRSPGRLISDDVLDAYPKNWLIETLPRVVDKVRGAYFMPIDPSIKSSIAHPKTEAHCLALPLLFGSLKEFLNAVQTAQQRTKGKECPRT
jgi:hypothetical protein